MSTRFAYRPNGPFGPDVIDRKTGRFMSMDLAREYAAVVNAAGRPRISDEAVEDWMVRHDIKVGGDGLSEARAMIEDAASLYLVDGVGSSNEGAAC